MPRTYSTIATRGATGDQTFNFIALPLEIKEFIYKHAILAGGHLDSEIFVRENIFVRGSGFMDRRSLHNSFPAICFTNKLERLIASRIYLRYQTICFLNVDDAPALRNFLLQFDEGNNGLNWLKLIRCGDSRYPCYGISKVVDLIKVCSALKTIVFHLHMDDVLRFRLNDEDCRLYTGTEISANLELHDLASCGHLSKIRFDLFKTHGTGLEGLKSIINDFSHSFSALHGSAAARRLDVRITRGDILLWVLEPQKRVQIQGHSAIYSPWASLASPGCTNIRV